VDLAEAVRGAYEAVDMIDWPDGFCRRDIGRRAVFAASWPK
jgi:phosphoribosylamine--glycine ligase